MTHSPLSFVSSQTHELVRLMGQYIEPAAYLDIVLPQTRNVALVANTRACALQVLGLLVDGTPEGSLDSNAELLLNSLLDDEIIGGTRSPTFPPFASCDSNMWSIHPLTTS